MKSSKFHKQFMTVTPLSRRIALLMVIFLPFIGFFLGYNFQKSTAVVDHSSPNVTASTPELVTQDFYSWYANCVNKSGDVNSCDWKKSPEVTNSFANTITQKKINLTCSENIPLGVVSKLISSDGRLATVDSYQVYEAGFQKVRVSLVNSSGFWKIDDISCD